MTKSLHDLLARYQPTHPPTYAMPCHAMPLLRAMMKPCHAVRWLTAGRLLAASAAGAAYGYGLPAYARWPHRSLASRTKGGTEPALRALHDGTRRWRRLGSCQTSITASQEQARQQGIRKSSSRRLRASAVSTCVLCTAHSVLCTVYRVPCRATERGWPGSCRLQKGGR